MQLLFDERDQPFVSAYLPVYAALGLAAGVWLGERLFRWGWFACEGEQLHPAAWWALSPLPLLLILWWRGWPRRRVVIPALAMGMALIGVWRYAMQPFEPCFGPNDLAYYNRDQPFGRPDILIGMVAGYPEKRENYNRYRVWVETIQRDGRRRPVQGVALVRTAADQHFFYGDRLRIRGVPETPPTFSSFDYRRFLARKRVHTLVRRTQITLLDEDQGNPFWAALYAFRARAGAALDQLLPQPYAALANGMILGIESGIPRDLYDDFNLTGASHVIVISGSNIAIISAIFLGLFIRIFGRRKNAAVVLALVGIVLYTLLVGADAAVTRAAIMGGLFVIAVGLGRQSVALISLFAAAWLMLLLNSLTLWDVGFQLSFMATLGLILFSRPLQKRWSRVVGERLPGLVSNLLAEGLLITLAAQITTLALVVFYFGRLSLVSFVANLLILPVQPPIMVVGGLAALVGMVLPAAARLIALIPHASLWWTVFVVEKLAALPWASLEVGAFGRLLAALYTAAFAAGFLWWLFRQEQGERALLPPTWRAPALRGATAAIAIILLLWTGASYAEAQPDGRLRVYQIGRERAAAWLIVTPGGRRVLLDPARDAALPLADLLQTLPRGRGSLDLHIVTRPQTEPSPAIVAAMQLRAGQPELAEGAVVRLDSGAALALLRAATEPTESDLFLLRYGLFTMLLPYELSQPAQQALLRQPSPGPILLPAPYPGTQAWPHPDLFAHLRPQTTLLPMGATYPPASQRALAASVSVAPIPTDAVIEINTDGRVFSLLQHPYPADVVQR
ncbi:MAG: ComEC family competence protein [Chloroflexi bacterium]|nr:ComEC family competence protein [Chloroflexota bacterium]